MSDLEDRAESPGSSCSKENESGSSNTKLRCCRMSENIGTSLGSVLKSNPSHLRHLDPSQNKLQDSGVNEISGFLESPHCKLESLGLLRCGFHRNGCGFHRNGCVSLVSALRSNPAHLKELDLSYNKPQDAGVQQLCGSHCKLESLRIRWCNVSEANCASLVSALKSTPSCLRELEMSGNKVRDSDVQQLYQLVEVLRSESF